MGQGSFCAADEAADGAYGYDNWAQKTEHGGKDFTLNIPAYYRDNWKQPGDISKYEVFIEKPAVA